MHREKLLLRSMGLSHNYGPRDSGVPNAKDYSILGSILGFSERLRPFGTECLPESCTLNPN